MKTNQPGLLLRNLPAIYHSSEALRELLSVFEDVLFGTGTERHLGLEQKIRSISRIFRPVAAKGSMQGPLNSTPSEFIPWLAKWVALGRYEEVAEEQLRTVISKIVPLYGKRGTKEFLEEILRLFIPEISAVDIDDRELKGFVVGQARIGTDSWLGVDRPFWFRVKVSFAPLTLDEAGHKKMERALVRKVRSVIDLSKPAHTTYDVQWTFADNAPAGIQLEQAEQQAAKADFREEG